MKVVPFPLTVIAVRLEEARATNSSVGEGRADTIEAAANAAATEKVFIMLFGDVVRRWI